MRVSVKLKTILLICIFLLGLINVSIAEEILPAEKLTALTLKVLDYDRSLENRTQDEITVAIVCPLKNERHSYAIELLKSFKEAEKKSQIRNLPFKTEIIHLHEHTNIDSQKLRDILIEKEVDVIVTVEHLEDQRVLFDEAKELKINTISATSEARCFKNGLAVGIALRNNRPKIFINIKNAENEGSDYSGKLLSLCTIIE